MAIQFACTCGKTLAVPDDLSGQKVRCPSCGQVLIAPAAAAPAPAPPLPVSGPAVTGVPIGAAPPPVGLAPGETQPAPGGFYPGGPFKRTSGMAVASMVVGIISIPFCCLGGPLGVTALVLGYLAIKEIDRAPEQIGGRGLALAGMITGGVGVLIHGLHLLTILPHIFH